MKNIIKRISLILSLVIILNAIPFMVYAETTAPETEAATEVDYYSFADGMGKEEIPYGPKAEGVSWYDYKNFKMMNESQAAAAGVPEGYSGWVLALDPASTNGMSIGLDLSHIKVADIEKITIRVWVPAGTSAGNGVRLTHKGEAWIMTAPCTQGQWNDIVLDEDQNFYTATMDFTVFDDGNGYCKAVNFCLRKSTGTAYIDHIKVELKAPSQETEAPTEAPTEPEVETVAPEEGKAEIPYTAEDTTYSKYGYSDMKVYSTSKAAEAGIPEGYTGDYVMALTNRTNLSITLDLRQTVCKDVKIEDVESISFKVWIPAKMDLRLKTTPLSNNNWEYIKSFSADSWHTITITDMSIFVDDGNGYFSPFSFTFRETTNAATDYTVYFDGITVKIKDPEPVKTHYTFEEGMGKEEIPYGAKATLGMSYGYSSFMMMDETQAIAAGVPEGYSGWVLALGSNGGNISIGLDLTNIQTRDIDNISFRVWCPTGTKQHATEGGIRLSGQTTSTWNMLASPTAIGEWIDVVLEKDSYDSLDYDGDGYCDPLNFIFRGATSTAYIDSITVNLRDPDVEPPVITYNGETVIDTREGREFVLDLTAHDAYYDVDITPEFIWSEGALNSEGKLVQGTHTCTVKATDEAGNSAQIVITVNVGERDTEAPSIDWMPEEIYAMAGMLPDLEIIVADNVDELDAVLTWSEGALDVRGRLTAGEHTLTISAVDLTGNKTEHTIAVHVLATRPVVGELIQDN